jgi:hypothetical protein
MKNEEFVENIEKNEQAQPQVVRKQKKPSTSANLVKKQEITIDQKITVKEFSEKM